MYASFKLLKEDRAVLRCGVGLVVNESHQDITNCKNRILLVLKLYRYKGWSITVIIIRTESIFGCNMEAGYFVRCTFGDMSQYMLGYTVCTVSIFASPICNTAMRNIFGEAQNASKMAVVGHFCWLRTCSERAYNVSANALYLMATLVFYSNNTNLRQTTVSIPLSVHRSLGNSSVSYQAN